MLLNYHSILISNKLFIENWYYNLEDDIKPESIDLSDNFTELRYDLSDCILLLDHNKIIDIIIQHCKFLKYRCPDLVLKRYDESELHFKGNDITDEIIYSFLS